MKLEFKYNTYSFENELLSEGLKQSLVVELTEKKGHKINFWLLDFLKLVIQEYNIDDGNILNLCIQTTKDDFFNVEQVVNEINNERITDIIKLKIKEDKTIAAYGDSVFDIIKNSKKNLPKVIYEKIEYYVTQLEDLQKNAIPITVIAPMSSGKSTLLNAIIGKELLPIDVEATTATICNILNSKKSKESIYNATILVDDKVEKEISDVTLEDITSQNKRGNNEKDVIINIDGRIKNLNTDTFNFLLRDTPGPNSSNLRHKEIYDEIHTIKSDKEYPLFIYIINANEQNTNANKDLLVEISKNAKAKNNREEDLNNRVIFILNKIDDDNKIFDGEKKVSDIIERNRKFLRNNGFKNPLIFPCSALLALRSQQDSKNLTRSKKTELNGLKDNFCEDENDDYLGLNLLDYSNIPARVKSQLKKDAEIKGKDLLNRSGLSSITAYIENYVNSNHKVNIINDIVSKIEYAIETEIKKKKHIINQQQNIAKDTTTIQKNIDKLKRLNQEIRNINIEESFDFPEDIFENAIRKIQANGPDLIKVLGTDINNSDKLKFDKNKITKINEALLNFCHNEKSKLNKNLLERFRNQFNRKKLELQKLLNDTFGEIDYNLFHNITMNNFNKMSFHNLGLNPGKLKKTEKGYFLLIFPYTIEFLSKKDIENDINLSIHKFIKHLISFEKSSRITREKVIANWKNQIGKLIENNRQDFRSYQKELENFNQHNNSIQVEKEKLENEILISEDYLKSLKNNV